MSDGDITQVVVSDAKRCKPYIKGDAFASPLFIVLSCTFKLRTGHCTPKIAGPHRARTAPSATH